MSTATLEPEPHDMRLIARLDRLRCTARRFPLSLIELGMRTAVGATFFRSGMLKLQSFDTTITLFRDEYRLPLLPPELAAYLGTAVELSAPVLLVLGVFARGGAAALLAMTLTIQFLVYPENWPEHLMWASILAYVLTRGAGALSIDRIVAFNLFGRA
ncbi:MAG: DoxX family protein [Enhydrobacter sp.]|nr:DoxX family protein [Enhydrobacter sp.]